MRFEKIIAIPKVPRAEYWCHRCSKLHALPRCTRCGVLNTELVNEIASIFQRVCRFVIFLQTDEMEIMPLSSCIQYHRDEFHKILEICSESYKRKLMSLAFAEELSRFEAEVINNN